VTNKSVFGVQSSVCGMQVRKVGHLPVLWRAAPTEGATVGLPYEKLNSDYFPER
jgi:hypothetical protein